MRTDVEVDDELMTRAMRATGISSQAEVINAALRSLVDVTVEGRRAAPGTTERVHGGNNRSMDFGAVPGRQTDLDLFGAHLGFSGAD